MRHPLEAGRPVSHKQLSKKIEVIKKYLSLLFVVFQKPVVNFVTSSPIQMVAAHTIVV